MEEHNIDTQTKSQLGQKDSVPDFVNLLKDAMRMLAERWRVILMVSLSASLVGLLATALLSSYLLPLVGDSNTPGLLFFMLVSGVITILLSAFWQGGMYISANNSDAKVERALALSWNMLLPLSFVILLSALIIGGAILALVIPGIIAMVFLTFTVPSMVIGGKRGFDAIMYSFEIVNGRWLEVFGRVIVLGVLMTLAGLIPDLIGDVAIAYDFVSFVFGIVLGAYSVCYMLVLYKSLATSAVKIGGDKRNRVKALFVGAIVLLLLSGGALFASTLVYGTKVLTDFGFLFGGVFPDLQVPRQIEDINVDNREQPLELEMGIPEAEAATYDESIATFTKENLDNGQVRLRLNRFLGDMSLLFSRGSVFRYKDEENDSVNFEISSGFAILSRDGSKGESANIKRLSLYTPHTVVMLQGTTTSEVLVSVRDDKHTDLFVLSGKGSIRGLTSDPLATGIGLWAGFMTTIDDTSSATEPREFDEGELPQTDTVEDFTKGKEGKSGKVSYLFYGAVGLLAVMLGAYFGKKRA